MKYLLDTHTAIWALLGDDDKLSAKAKKLLRTGRLNSPSALRLLGRQPLKISKGGNIADMSEVTVFKDKLCENGVEIVGITTEEVKIR